MMWKVYEDLLMDSNMLVEYEASFYCGDSAGRKVNPTSKKPDFSDTDLKFSLNIGFPFRTPE